MSMFVSPDSEDHPIQERMPAGYFDEMASRIWRIGTLAYGKTFDMVMPPAVVRLPALQVSALALQLTFEFKQNPITEAPEPTYYRALVAETEPYEPIPGASLWTWREFGLDMRRRSRDFWRGMSVLMEDCTEITLTNAPAIGQRQSNARSLENLRRLDEIGSADDYVWFMENLETIYENLREA